MKYKGFVFVLVLMDLLMGFSWMCTLSDILWSLITTASLCWLDCIIKVARELISSCIFGHVVLLLDSFRNFPLSLSLTLTRWLTDSLTQWLTDSHTHTNRSTCKLNWESDTQWECCDSFVKALFFCSYIHGFVCGQVLFLFCLVCVGHSLQCKWGPKTSLINHEGKEIVFFFLRSEDNKFPIFL